MKNKLRNITVGEQSFVYWYSSGTSFNLNISPKNDKTSKISLIFAADAPADDPIMFWVFYKIHAFKDNSEASICLTSPKNIAEIISFLLHNTENPFMKGHTRIINNAMDLLYEMGYTSLTPVWIREW